jgi:hypothetical protein
LALQGAQRQTVIPDKTRSVAIHSLKDLDDAYQAVGELVDILSEWNLVSVPRSHLKERMQRYIDENNPDA